MRTESVMSTSVTLSLQRYRQPVQQLAFFEELESRMHRLPGIGNFALTDSVPLMPGGTIKKFLASSNYMLLDLLLYCFYLLQSFDINIFNSLKSILLNEFDYIF